MRASRPKNQHASRERENNTRKPGKEVVALIAKINRTKPNDRYDQNQPCQCCNNNQSDPVCATKEIEEQETRDPLKENAPSRSVARARRLHVVNPNEARH